MPAPQLSTAVFVNAPTRAVAMLARGAAVQEQLQQGAAQLGQEALSSLPATALVALRKGCLETREEVSLFQLVLLFIYTCRPFATRDGQTWTALFTI